MRIIVALFGWASGTSLLPILNSPDFGLKESAGVRMEEILKTPTRWSVDQTNFVRSYLGTVISQLGSHRLNMQEYLLEPDYAFCEMLQTLIQPTSEQVTHCGSDDGCLALVKAILGDVYRYQRIACKRWPPQQRQVEDAAIRCYEESLASGTALFSKYLLTPEGARTKTVLSLVLADQEGNRPRAIAHLQELTGLIAQLGVAIEDYPERVIAYIGFANELLEAWTGSKNKK